MIDIHKYSTVRESQFYTKLKNDKVRCDLCERRCVILPNEMGVCKTRINLEGRLYTLVYGDLSAIESRPIEIKPFFHYYPGSTALTFSTWSCNFKCPWCQNYHLSKVPPNPSSANFYPPERLVQLSKKFGDAGLCASFQEPTLLTDYCIPTFSLGREAGLYCCYVSNGYMTIKALKKLREAGMDGLKIDVKGNSETYSKYCGGVDVEVVWRNAKTALELGMHVEIVNLVITGVNDSEGCIREVVEKHVKLLGEDTPIHFTRYYPAYKFLNPPTSIEKLEEAYRIAKEMGVKYPYIGNVLGHPYEDTYCPNCGYELIKRYGCRILKCRLTRDKRCPRCGESISIKGRVFRG